MQHVIDACFLVISVMCVGLSVLILHRERRRLNSFSKNAETHDNLTRAEMIASLRTGVYLGPPMTAHELQVERPRLQELKRRGDARLPMTVEEQAEYLNTFGKCAVATSAVPFTPLGDRPSKGIFAETGTTVGAHALEPVASGSDNVRLIDPIVNFKDMAVLEWILAGKCSLQVYDETIVAMDKARFVHIGQMLYARRDIQKKIEEEKIEEKRLLKTIRSL